MKYKTETHDAYRERLRAEWKAKYKDWHKVFAWWPTRVATDEKHHTFIWLGYLECRYPFFYAWAANGGGAQCREIQKANCSVYKE